MLYSVKDSRLRQKKTRQLKSKNENLKGTYKSHLLEYKRKVVDPEARIHQNSENSKHIKQIACLGKNASSDASKNKRHNNGCHDIFALNNMVFINTTKELRITRDTMLIPVPEYKTVENLFYIPNKESVDNSISVLVSSNVDCESDHEEDDSDERYVKLHYPLEILEQQNKRLTD